MLPLLTAAQMRAAEQAAMDTGQATGLQLMERAGQAVVDAVFERWPHLSQGAHEAVVLCGPGNNGGDGFVIARLLKTRGWDVKVFFIGQVARLPPDARTSHDRWAALGPVLDTKTTEVPRQTDLYVDALLGTGLSRPTAGAIEACVAHVQKISAGRAPLVSVDVPTGLCADSGRRLGLCFDVDLTVTFHHAKRGHYLQDGPSACGALVVKDIGIVEPLDAPIGRDTDVVRLVTPPDPDVLLKEDGHKFSHGHALVVTGGFGKTGAARLAARAALRVGAGLVTLAVPGSAQMEVAAQITGLMMTRVDDAEALARSLTDRRLTALCLGPGLGMERARSLVDVALRAPFTRLCVLDADALSSFADAPEVLFEMLHRGCVLTPHGGEFARLFPDIAARLAEPARQGPAYSKTDATCDAAKRAGCVVVFKGADTVIADPNGNCVVHAAAYERAAPWLATAGSGDVLAGLICGLMARRNVSSALAACAKAAWLHVECARIFGPGLIAEDLPDLLPEVLRGLPEG